jgi:large-conductance mechanosensitive channel
MVIVPRPPMVKAPQFTENNLLLSGTGLANSEVVLTVSIGANNYTQIAEINGDGNWNTSITLENIYDGIYTIFGYTRKNGYASNPSEPAVMEYGNDGIVNVDTNPSTDIAFDFNNIQFNNISEIITSNPDLLIILISFLLFGALITSVIFLLTRRKDNKDKTKEISKQITNNKPKEEKTLRELFEEDNSSKKTKNRKSKKKKKNQKVKAKRNKKKKKPKVEKVFTKEDFLKDFEDFDPDTDKGKENKEPSKKDKKDVIVTLTSQREED